MGSRIYYKPTVRPHEMCNNMRAVKDVLGLLRERTRMSAHSWFSQFLNSM